MEGVLIFSKAAFKRPNFFEPISLRIWSSYKLDKI